MFIRHEMRWHFCSSQSPPGQERSWSFFEKVPFSLRRVVNIQRPALFSSGVGGGVRNKRCLYAAGELRIVPFKFGVPYEKPGKTIDRGGRIFPASSLHASTHERRLCTEDLSSPFRALLFSSLDVRTLVFTRYLRPAARPPVRPPWRNIMNRNATSRAPPASQRSGRAAAAGPSSMPAGTGR